MKEIFTGNEDSIEVWGVSHAGHVVLPKDMQKPYLNMKRFVHESGNPHDEPDEHQEILFDRPLSS